MRGLVIHLLLILILTGSPLVHSESARPVIQYSPAFEKSDFQRHLAASGQKGILFDTLLQPPHPSMVKAALATGKHAFFQGIYGSFHIGAESRLPSPGNIIKEAPPHSPEHTASPPSLTPALLVGKNFAWLSAGEIPAREEKRPVTPEDLGATFLLLTQKHPVQPLGGRDIKSAAPWPVLVTHTGEWKPNIAPERMKHRGLVLLSPDGMLENELIWNGLTLDKIPETELARVTPLLKLCTLWWTQIMPHLNQPLPITIPAGGQTTFLAPNQWQRSCVEPGLPYMPPTGGTWTRRTLSAALDHIPAPGMGGCWRLDVPREGNYEITFSLNPSSDEDTQKHLFKKGDALIRAGNTTARMEIMKGAEEIRIAIDLAAGIQNLEINVTGQGDKDACLSVPYAGIRHKGERITPVIDFQNRTQ